MLRDQRIGRLGKNGQVEAELDDGLRNLRPDPADDAMADAFALALRRVGKVVTDRR
ncbi:MAG: hypothetical protein WB902_01590 [Acetobacteraceae bacterium]|jgi:hypothetical protein